MSRLRRNRIIDSMIQKVRAVTESQCSLSEQDYMILDKAISRLQRLKHTKGKTYGQLRQDFVSIVNSLLVFFVEKRCVEEVVGLIEIPNTP